MQWKRWIKLFVVTILTVVVIVFAALLWSKRWRPENHTGIESTLMLTPVKQPSGEIFDPGRLNGRWVLVHFWASWCAPCEEELPALVSFADQVPQVLVLAVSLDQGWSDADKMLEPLKRPKNWIDVLDTKLRLPEALGTYQYPETYLYDTEGQLAAKWVGPQPWSAPKFIQIFTERVSKK